MLLYLWCWNRVFVSVISFYLFVICVVGSIKLEQFLLSEAVIEFVEEIDLGVSFNVGSSE